jgi:hypothetical protein
MGAAERQKRITGVNWLRCIRRDDTRITRGDDDARANLGRLENPRAPDDAIYIGLNLNTIPHRIRVRQVLAELRNPRRSNLTYADVGCGGVSITSRIVNAIQPPTAVGYDRNSRLVEFASRAFPNISFRAWDFAQEDAPAETYDLVTCLKTLEHIEDVQPALANLLKITGRTLLVTVPIELGLLGAAKFGLKAVLGRQPLTEEHSGSALAYLRTVLTRGKISNFRAHPKGGSWLSHTGFDCRIIDSLIESQPVTFAARNRGWNRFYRITRTGTFMEPAGRSNPSPS